MRNIYDKYTDEELMEFLEGGKKEADEAFKVIYKRYSNRIFAYALKVLNDNDAADDIFQETFIKFYQAARDQKKRGSLQGFLITITRNLCLNYKRDKKNNVEVEDYHVTVDDDFFDFKHEKQNIIKKAINRLEDDYKEALVLRVYEGLAYKEIADICKISEENARKRVFRAKKKIKEFLTPFKAEFQD